MNRFKYSQTYTINAVVKFTTDKNGELVDISINDHCSKLDEFHYTFKDDGYYEIYHIILPSKDWYDTNTSSLDLDIYVTDGTDIYKKDKDTLSVIAPEELLVAKCEGTTLSLTSLAQFSICNLYACYIDACKKLFEGTLSSCSKESADTFKRDIVWMAINVIKYYVELGQLMEAQRLLEELTKCGGICNDIKSSSKQGCGCARRA